MSNFIHHCTICTEEQYKDFENGTLKYNIYSETLVPYHTKSLDENKELVNMTFKEYQNFIVKHNYEFYKTTKDNIVCFGLIGNYK